METSRSHPELTDRITDFLTDLTHANRSEATVRTYATDLAQFAAFHQGPVASITVGVLRAFFRSLAHLQPASRARKQAALTSFLTWAYRHDHISANPMLKVERVKPSRPMPRGIDRAQVEAVLAAIPKTQERDRLLFRLLVETGLRIGEARQLYVEDVDLTRDDEHLTVHGKGGKRRTILLDHPRLVAQLRAYLHHTGYQHGYLFRAQKNGRGDALRYQSIHERWQHYCQHAGVVCTLHQLRHLHATELINDGVSLNTIRKRLGHQHIQTTLRYAEQTDAVADAELRARRRRKERGG
jgi:site-specific recombinase XerD